MNGQLMKMIEIVINYEIETQVASPYVKLNLEQVTHVK